MSRTKAVLQILLALILFLVAVATLVNMALITMRTEDTDTISVVNTIIGQTVLIVCLVALGRIQLKKGLARYRDIDNSSAPQGSGGGNAENPRDKP
ncbi:MAG: hypothetical protein R3F41_16065 [Gammaproteobacteria bacterium]|nr:hypothetical protein [Pseudomonadales bacterium]MCP5346712.1 hypothetical protein [Pseudomonadales bacterium]